MGLVNWRVGKLRLVPFVLDFISNFINLLAFLVCARVAGTRWIPLSTSRPPHCLVKLVVLGGAVGFKRCVGCSLFGFSAPAPSGYATSFVLDRRYLPPPLSASLWTPSSVSMHVQVRLLGSRRGSLLGPRRTVGSFSLKAGSPAARERGSQCQGWGSGYGIESSGQGWVPGCGWSPYFQGWGSGYGNKVCKYLLTFWLFDI